ncbi:ankyrin repeat domain-containing protein [Litoribacter populi]|uniref:ankyrin repeat domain-containing protein n=1 Tax=Litoribacter populi TaxID=2598460 RepID=UPI00117FC996|nr:ankyrin repeat domain-containing protein [Litoribacter populi]
MSYLTKIIEYFELHSVEGIKECFERGIDPNLVYNEKPLIYELINMYSRGPLFKDCIRVFMDYGLEFEDKALLNVLVDDSVSLDKLLNEDKKILLRKYSLDCAFTPLKDATLMHICAEYNHLSCAKILVKHRIDINSKAGFDQWGFGGHTPIFHTVNQNENVCVDVMRYLVSKNADLNITVQGLIWGENYEWETFIPAVNPISYSMMGLLRQFQRTEKDIYEVVSVLMKKEYGVDYFPTNIPNKYLNPTNIRR